MKQVSPTVKASIFKASLAISTLLFAAGCGSSTVDTTSEAQPSPTQSSAPNPEATETGSISSEASSEPIGGGTGEGTTVSSNEERHCTTDPVCLEISKTTEEEVQQIYDQLISQLAMLTPVETRESITSSVIADHEAWTTYRNTNCNVERNSAASIGSRTVRGATLNYISAACRIEFNQERKTQLMTLLSRVDAHNKFNSSATSNTSLFSRRRVQDLAQDGDYFLSAAEPPFELRQGDKDYLLLRKQGNVSIGMTGTTGSEENCLRIVIISNDEVATTVPEQEKFTTRIDNGVVGDAHRFYDVTQFPGAAERLKYCENLFSNSID